MINDQTRRDRFQISEQYAPEVILDRALSFLGRENISALYYQLEAHGIKRSDIFNQPEQFANALHSFFGIGAKIVENEILKELIMSPAIGEQYDINMTLVEVMQKLKNIH